MLSLIQVGEIRNAVVEYLKATYNFDDRRVEQAFEDFLYDKRYGMFKGPYIQIRLPFKKIDAGINVGEILTIRPSFPPYLHQYEAFKNLSTKNSTPKPVILTTGTGSGKTESFLYPLLDYCYKNVGRPGIKAIILYPMNALATDQARRLAEVIHNYQDESGNYILRGRIRAGLFIGEGRQKGKDRATRMEEQRVIEDRNTLVESPPDILLTNFKMLDFSLMQARFHKLWNYNHKDSSLLKFIVLDELHTYDGAKGSDVANLIRRLKLKLSLGNDQLVPVGTSATMSGGSDGKKELIKFFSLIFGMEIAKDSVIEEHREDPELFFSDALEIPQIDFKRLSECEFNESDEYESYISRQLNFWNYSNDHQQLLEQLKRNKWLFELILLCGNGVVELDSAVTKWLVRCFPDNSLSYTDGFRLLQSLTGIVSYAKEQSGKRYFPFVYFQTSYWIRSLHRIIRKLQPTPLFAWETDQDPNDKFHSLPPYYCRECGGSGWIGIKKEHNDYLEDDLSRTRLMFMADRQNKNIWFLSSIENVSKTEVIADDYSPTADLIDCFINPETLQLTDNRETPQSFKIFGVRRQDDDSIEKVCPHCNSRNTLALIGTGLPTLESIVAAQLMATATDPADDHDRKLLAFTNGVQDAAHQAGFIESRNYRFGMRHAIQSVLKQSDRITLPQLYRDFERLWRERLQNQEKSDEAYFYKYLPPDCDGRISIKDFQQKDKSFSREFLTEFQNRVSWEIWSEFSFSAGIGRTLEKSGASAVEFDISQFEDVYNQIKYWLEKETLGDRINEQLFFRFLLGFLHRLRFKGGVDHIYLKKYRSERTNYWLITQNTNKKHFLIKNFGKNSRLPKFATLFHGPNTSAFEIIQSQGGKHNWYSTWFLKCFPLVAASNTDLINEFYQKLFEYLEANRLLDKKVAAGVNNVGLNPDQIFLTTDVKSFECSKCGNPLNVGSANHSIVNGMPCLQHRCTGTYSEKDNVFDYYRMVYNRGRALRIFAKDHTGLIDREKRERLERDFKLRPTYQSTNVLVATSTLEMGIDIGDLNIAFNASIPPETSNYLQRVGRAGRASGTSLIVNLAGRDQHDQYFFEDTMSMMQGDIRTPSCYLGARDILRRHFMAFCFDSWASADPDNHNIPVMVRLLRVKSLPLGDSRFIFNQLAEFISTNKSRLFTAFKQKYSDQDALQAIQQIEIDLQADQPAQQLRSIHSLLLNELDYYRKKMSDIDSQLKKLPNTGQESEDLKKEKRALAGAIYNINRRNTIEYLTNQGILPNYAFPETGVHINAQIVSRVDEQGGSSRYRVEEFGEIVRPASSAITELAPGNVFYSQGYKLESQGLEIFGSDAYEVWRFCSNCDTLKLDVDVPKEEVLCPKCRHNSWGSLANKKILLKLHGVNSVNDRDGSKINDSSDDRDRKFYNKSVHLRTDPRTSRGAKVLRRIPFGIEFFTSTEYFEVNTGIREEGFFGNRKLVINDKENPEVGFVVCKTCGKATERPLAQYELDKKLRSYHFNYCSHRNAIYQGHADDNFQELYLYRRFQTEALKVLLPVQDFRTEERVSIFKAGLLLGLKNYYKGHPDHVNVREYEEFNTESGRKERFLVMYESIPGGTGYLSRLYNTEEFTRLLTVAYDHIKHCTCKDEGKDGCYKCIYTYANQYERETLSRHEAEHLFKDIIDKSSEWTEAGSLTNLMHVANNEESELEERFIALLKTTFQDKVLSGFEEHTENGLRRYRLTLKDVNDSITYEIWPQNLGYSLAGVRYSTRPDFLFRCVALKKNGQLLPMELVQQVKDTVVYLDGYQFHASASNHRVFSDIKIRDAIVESNRYHLWAFSWEDIISHAVDKSEDHLFKRLNLEEISRISLKHPVLKGFDFVSIKRINSFLRFEVLLRSPLSRVDLKLWSAIQLFACQTKLLGKCLVPERVDAFLDSGRENDFLFEPGTPQQFALSDALQFSQELKIIALGDPTSLDIKAAFFHQEPDGDYVRENWELFIQTYNLLQFHNYKGIEKPDVVTEESTGAQAILDNFRSELHPIVTQLLENGISINTNFDFDVMEGDVIVASAELGSEKNKFFMYPFDGESRHKLLKLGYREFDLNNFHLKELL